MTIFAEELIKVKGAIENYYKLWINGKCLIHEIKGRINAKPWILDREYSIGFIQMCG
jgi:hypothetical protein